MPEGDTIHGAADRLAAELGGEVVTAASGTHRAMIEYGNRIVGTRVDEATAHGKHLLIHFSNGWTLRTHLQMTGTWHIYGRGERWRKSQGKARVVLETAECVAVCFAAPTVQLGPHQIVAKQIAGLGPDLMAAADFASLAERVRQMAGAEAVCNAIVDQSVVSGLGNVYKSELLFLEGIHPDAAVNTLTRDQIARIVERAHKLLVTNRGVRRTTTGSRAPGRSVWVYGRSGRPCRRCDTLIEYGERGPLARHTYWCPSCQPIADASGANV